jgi:hypothetical protein
MTDAELQSSIFHVAIDPSEHIADVYAYDGQLKASLRWAKAGTAPVLGRTGSRCCPICKF